MSKELRRNLRVLREIAALIWSVSDRFSKGCLGWVLLLALTAATLNPLSVVGLKLIIDRFTVASNTSVLSIGTLIGLYVLSQWGGRSLAELHNLLYVRAERRITRRLSDRLFSHIMSLPLGFHLKRRTGGLSQALDIGLQGYQLALHQLVFTVLPAIAQLGTVAVVLMHFEQPVFLALFCVAAVCYAGVFSFFATRIGRTARRLSAAQVDSSAVITDSILNYETVKYFAAETAVQAQVGQALSRTERNWVGFARIKAGNGLAISTVFAIFLVLSISFASHAVETGRMTVGDFVLVNAYLLQIIAPVEMFGRAMQGFSQGFAMLENMLALLHETSEQDTRRPFIQVVTPPQDEAPLPVALTRPSELVFEQVCFAYHPDHIVLTDISFVLRAGGTLGVVGASGAGKSTLVRLLMRLFEPESGRILLDGVPISTLTLGQLRRAIAVVPQDTVLFDNTIGHNISFGAQNVPQAEIQQAAKIAHLHDFVMVLPEGYETRVGERGVRLSGGERQRVSIARAVLKRPLIYVFDEATSSLDSRTERSIVQNLRDVSRDTTTLMIAHRLSTVMHSDEIIVLHEGRIIERGTHDSLLALEGKYASLWRMQQRSGATSTIYGTGRG